MREPGAELFTRIGKRQHGDIAKVPVPFVGMGKAVDHGIFVFIPGAGAVFRHGAELYHGVGKRAAGKRKPRP